MSVDAANLIELGDIDDVGFTAWAYERGWTDGLPAVAPTEQRVSDMLGPFAAVRHRAFGTMAPGFGDVTPELVAASAVMAGAEPTLFPYVWASVLALIDPEYNLAAVQATTNPVSPVIVVNMPRGGGPAFNAGHNCLGQGNRANATLGRAVRFCLTNIGLAFPGLTDMATQGHPGKFGSAFAENEARNPWASLSVDRGVPTGDPAVTVFQAACYVNVLDVGSSTANELLQAIAGTMGMVGSNNLQVGKGDLLVVLSPEHAHILAREGLSKEEVRRAIAQNSTVPVAAIPQSIRDCLLDWRSHEYRLLLETSTIPIVERWEDICVAVAGGSGPQTMVVPGFGDGRSVTRTVEFEPA